MSLKHNFILLLKATASDEPDKFVIELNKYNYILKHVKTLDFEYINLTTLEAKLNNPDLYSGIVFSSPRCVNATKRALDGNSLKKAWFLKDNYGVGETTCELAQKELKLNCMGKESGNALNLAEIMLNSKNYEKPFIMPHGNLKTDHLKTALNNEIKIEDVLVYDTIKNSCLSQEIEIATNNYLDLPEYIVFFSPSGVRHTLNYVNQFINENIKLIAIGPVTARAMLEYNLKVSATALKPTPDSLINTIRGIT